jgi:hypothetical protein
MATALANPLLAGETYTSITVLKGTTNLANQTNQWFCLIWKDGVNYKTLRSTTNGTNGAWTASSTKTLNLSSTLTPVADTQVWVGVCVTVSSGMIGLNVAGIGAVSAQWPLTDIEPRLNMVDTGSRTTPLADNTTITTFKGSGTARFYAYVS